MYENDPLWRLRYAIAGLAIALLVSVPLAALLATALADLVADRYGLRVAIYVALLVYVIVGAVRLFLRVAQHERQPLGPRRLLLWLLSLWLWPWLLRGPADGSRRTP